MKQGVFYDIIYIEIIMLAGTIGLEVFAGPIISVFAMLRETDSLKTSKEKVTERNGEE